MIHAYSSESHYLNKLRPIYDALPHEIKGELRVHPRLDGTPGAIVNRYPRQDGVLMVASTHDAQWAKDQIIYIEHGTGQTYETPINGYSDTHRPNLLASVVPGPHCAAKTSSANPGVPCLIMGAPHLADIERDPSHVVLAWHWRCSVVVETMTAFDEYKDSLRALNQKFRCLGHGHPRILPELTNYYHQAGIEVSFDYRDALKRAKVLVADNTSLIYEAAALDIPVVLVNSKKWRRDKHHGLRFWGHLPGPMVDDPSELPGVIAQELDTGGSAWKEDRRRITAYLYGTNPFGRAAAVGKHLGNLAYALPN